MGRDLAQRLGISSYSDLLTCTQEANQVNVDVNFGRNAGVQGTPAVMVRYDDGEAQWITFGGTTYNRANVPYSVLAQVVENAE
jgi:hypothetical protein